MLFKAQLVLSSFLLASPACFWMLGLEDDVFQMESMQPIRCMESIGVSHLLRLHACCLETGTAALKLSPCDNLARFQETLNERTKMDCSSHNAL